jgi:hypothetical protein
MSFERDFAEDLICWTGCGGAGGVFCTNFDCFNGCFGNEICDYFGVDFFDEEAVD